MYNYNNQKMIEQRTIEVGEYIAATGATVRQAAKMFGISKSLVHRDMRGRLKDLDYDLWNDVQKVLAVNLGERHLRGGQATRTKWEAMHRKPIIGLAAADKPLTESILN